MFRNPVAGATLLIHLGSWRYILGVSLLAYLFTLILFFYRPFLLGGSLSLLAGLVTLFSCWRLRMDERFFALFYQYEGQTAGFDFAIHKLWSKDLNSKTLEQRWTGVSKLIKHAWLAVLIQWFGVIVMLISAALNQ